MRGSVGTLVLYSFAVVLTSAGREEIAFLKDMHVFVGDSAGGKVRQIDKDPRKKGLLRWDTYRKRLSFLTDPGDKEVARVAVMDLDGKIVTEAAIPPITDPPTCCIRFIEDLWWLPNGKLRVEGSINPMNCMLFDLDIDTGRDSNWHDGVCGSFRPSPDGKHLIERHKNYPAAEEDQIDVMQVDDRERFYKGDDPKGVFWLAGPAWSPDSQNIALIEKAKATGNVSLVILSLTGAVTRIPAPAGVAEHPAVTWVGDKVVAGEGADAMQVDSRTRHVALATYDVADVLNRAAKARKEAQAKAKRIEDVVRKLGGREGIALESAEDSRD